MSGLRPLALLLVSVAVAGCGGGGGAATAPEVGTPPPPPVPPPVNVNVDDPVLKVLDNAPVATGSPGTLVWSDEFDGSRLDPRTWFFESGDGSQYGTPGWGNDELQWYLQDSALLEGGRLVITARRQASHGKAYTSARINTRDRLAIRYGRIEALIRLPAGQGLWPAFWLMPQASTYGPWAASGEIDVLEARNLGGSGGNTIRGGLAYGGPWPQQVSTGEDYAVAASVTSEFHLYALEWDPTEIRWYVDGTLFAVRNAWSSTGGAFPAPFDKPFYLLFNVAVGGHYPGSPAPTTEFPVTMEVDYVRVYSGVP